MGQNLVIVESPAKAKTISKYLGKNYTGNPNFLSGVPCHV